jgi:hypothetical protein
VVITIRNQLIINTADFFLITIRPHPSDVSGFATLNSCPGQYVNAYGTVWHLHIFPLLGGVALTLDGGGRPLVRGTPLRVRR